MGSGSSRPCLQFGDKKFVIQSVVGQGGYGVVRAIQDEETGVHYACKEMSKANLIERKGVKGVMREREILARLNCSCIVSLHLAFQDEEYLYMIMTLLTGGDLKHHLHEKKKTKSFFSEETVKFWAACLIYGLAHLHDRQIIHRDIKDANLLLDSRGYLYISDFGVSVIMRDGTMRGRTGTPNFIAPEMIRGDPYNEKVDLWSAGVTLYLMAFKKYPWELPFPFNDEEKAWRESSAAKDTAKKASEIQQERNFPMKSRALIRILRERSPGFPLDEEEIREKNGNGLHEENGDEKGGKIPSSSTSPCFSRDFLDLLNKLLCPVEERLSARQALKHPFFKDFDWSQLERKVISPPFAPGNLDTNKSETDNGELGFLVEAVFPDQQKLFEGWDWETGLDRRLSFRMLQKDFRQSLQVINTRFTAPVNWRHNICFPNAKKVTCLVGGGKFIYCGFQDGHLRVFRDSEIPVRFIGKPAQKHNEGRKSASDDSDPPAHLGPISTITYTQGYLLTGSNDLSVKIWSPRKVEKVFKRQLFGGHLMKLSPSSPISDRWQKRYFECDKYNRVVRYYTEHQSQFKGMFLVKKEIDDDTTISSSSLGDLRMTGWKIDEQDGGVLYSGRSENSVAANCLLFTSVQEDSSSSLIFRLIGEKREFVLKAESELMKKKWLKFFNLAISPPEIRPLQTISCSSIPLMISPTREKEQIEKAKSLKKGGGKRRKGKTRMSNIEDKRKKTVEKKEEEDRSVIVKRGLSPTKKRGPRPHSNISPSIQKPNFQGFSSSSTSLKNHLSSPFTNSSPSLSAGRPTLFLSSSCSSSSATTVSSSSFFPFTHYSIITKKSIEIYTTSSSTSSLAKNHVFGLLFEGNQRKKWLCQIAAKDFVFFSTGNEVHAIFVPSVSSSLAKNVLEISHSFKNEEKGAVVSLAVDQANDNLLRLWGGTKDGKLLQWKLPLPYTMSSSKTSPKPFSPTLVIPTPHRSVSCLLYLDPSRLVSLGNPANEFVVWDAKDGSFLRNVLLSHVSPFLSVAGVGCLVMKKEKAMASPRASPRGSLRAPPRLPPTSPRTSPRKTRPKRQPKPSTNQNLLILKKEEGQKDQEGVICHLVSGGEGELLVSECAVPSK